MTPTGAKRFDVEIGLSDDNKSQIISDAIKVGDKVIVSSSVAKKKQMPKGARPF